MTLIFCSSTNKHHFTIVIGVVCVVGKGSGEIIGPKRMSIVSWELSKVRNGFVGGGRAGRNGRLRSPRVQRELHCAIIDIGTFSTAVVYSARLITVETVA